MRLACYVKHRSVFGLKAPGMGRWGVVRYVKMLAAKPDHLGSVPRIHMIGEKSVHPLSSDLRTCTAIPTCAQKHTE